MTCFYYIYKLTPVGQARNFSLGQTQSQPDAAYRKIPMLVVPNPPQLI
jgi:hypothetical protein